MRLLGGALMFSAQSTGSFSKLQNLFLPAPATTTSYQNTKGFLTTSGTGRFPAVKSDRMFSSRQQLIQPSDASARGRKYPSGNSKHTLQYLGTLPTPRDLEQPYFTPNPHFQTCPGILVYQALILPQSTNNICVLSGSAGDLEWQRCHSADVVLQDLINLPCLRYVIPPGNTVMKRRFPLSRLSRLDSAANPVP